MKDQSVIIIGCNLVTTLFDSDVQNFLFQKKDSEILKWLDDSSYLLETQTALRSPTGGFGSEYYDYSFMVTPAFKSLERWLLEIAPYIGVDEKILQTAEEKGRLGAFLNDEAMKDIVDGIVSKLGEALKDEQQLRNSLTSLNAYLKTLRHNPAHCGHIINHANKAKTIFYEIVGLIDRVTKHLLEEKIIKPV